MNPITETRWTLVRYVVLWGLFAVAYAAAFGLPASLPPWTAALDGAVFALVAGFEGLILWSVLKYGTVETPASNFFLIGRFLQVTVVGLLFIAVAVGSECLAVWASTETLPPTFVATLPARCLTTAAVYACFALWFSSAARSNGQERPRLNGQERQQQISSTTEIPQPAAAEPLERITVRGSGGRIEVISIGEIVYLQAEGDYVAIVTPSGRWLKEGTMKWFEESLPRDRFVRVHRSYIVAVGHISRIETSGRDHTLVLRNSGGGNSNSVRISDTGYRLLKRTLGL